MNGTNSEFARNHDGKATDLAQRGVPEIWTRRINLNPTGNNPASRKEPSATRRRLIIKSFSSAGFAVRWMPANRQESKDRLRGRRPGTARLESARIVLISG